MRSSLVCGERTSWHPIVISDEKYMFHYNVSRRGLRESLKQCQYLRLMKRVTACAYNVMLEYSVRNFGICRLLVQYLRQ